MWLLLKSAHKRQLVVVVDREGNLQAKVDAAILDLARLARSRSSIRKLLAFAE
jgi:hypothetical protein